MKKLTVGIIGAGRIGQLHANNILQSEQMNLKAIADIKLDHLQTTSLSERIPLLTTEPDEIIHDPEIDAIIISSSTDTHVDFIKKAANEGKHIFCEKPISFYLEATREALEVVKHKGVKFQSGFNRRFDKNFRYVYECVRNGKIGDPHIVKITSRDPEIPPEEYIRVSGGLFIDMTIHDFDMARYLAGSEVVEVSVKAANLVDPVFGKYDDVDTAVVVLTFENGLLAVIDNSRRAVYGYDQRIEVFGSKGVVVADNEKQTTVSIATQQETCSANPEYFFLERYQEAYVAEIHSFADSILNNKPIVCTGEDGYQAELLAHAAKISKAENRSVKLAELTKVNQ